MRSIRSKMIVSLLVLSLSSVGISSFWIYERAKASLDVDLGERLVAIAQATAVQFDGASLAQWIPESQSRTYRSLVENLSRLRQATDVERIYLFDKELRSLADTQTGVAPGSEYLRLRADRFEIDQVWGGIGTASVRFTGIDGREYKSGYAPIRDGDEVVAAIGVDMSAGFLATLRQLRRQFWVLMALVTGATLIVGLLLARRITDPVFRLVGAARRIRDAELSTAISLESRDELGYLGHTMEEMRQGIVERDTQLKLMLANVAHEIRNPLGGIELFAGLASEDLPSEHPSQESLTRIRNEARNLNRIITEFLEFARPQPCEPRTVNLQILFEDLSFLIAQELENQGIEYHMELPDVEVYVDPEQTKRAFLNVLRNALQAMTDGGRLSVKGQRDGDRLLVQVHDTGTGIAPENLERLFDPFFTTKEKGTGLGLAIVKRDIEANRGQIHITSVIGEGTTVSVYLPLTEQDHRHVSNRTDR